MAELNSLKESGRPASVLVTDGNERAALAITRALGMQGIEVLVGAETSRSLAGTSRHCAKAIQYPSPYEEPKQFIDRLIETVIEHRVGMVMPVSDMAMQLVGERRHEVEVHAIVPAPPLAVYEAVTDKYRLMKLAETLGVPTPATLYVEDGRLPQDLSCLGEFPIIVKPGRSRVLIERAWVSTKVQVASTRNDLERIYENAPYLRLPSLLQGRIEGEGQGIFALFDHGTPLVLFAHRRIREKPPSGGISVLRESIRPPKAMSDHAVRLLQKVGWHGPAMVEFKVEAGTGIPRLMEINGRFWGSLQLAIDAGVNFPWLLYHLALGQVMNFDQDYRVGVKSRWLLGDLDHLLARILKSDKINNLPPGYPSRWQCTREFLKFWEKDTHYEVERWDDRGPACHEWAAYLKTLLKVHA